MDRDAAQVLVRLDLTEARALDRLARRYKLRRPQVLRLLLRAEVERERKGQRLALPGDA